MQPFLRQLQQPDYLHVLLNPLPVYGVGIALLGLILSLFFPGESARRIALILIFLSAVSAWPVAFYGGEAYDVQLALSDAAGAAWLTAHRERATALVWAFYILAASAAAALFLPKRWPKLTTPLTVLTLVLALVSLGAGSYIAYAGGKVRHKEFRNVPPPETPRREAP